MMSAIRAVPVRVRTFRVAKVHVTAQNIDSELRGDVKMLGKILGASINNHAPRVFETVEYLRRLGREVYLQFLLIRAFLEQLRSLPRHF